MAAVFVQMPNGKHVRVEDASIPESLDGYSILSTDPNLPPAARQIAESGEVAEYDSIGAIPGPKAGTGIHSIGDDLGLTGEGIAGETADAMYRGALDEYGNIPDYPVQDPDDRWMPESKYDAFKSGQFDYVPESELAFIAQQPTEGKMSWLMDPTHQDPSVAGQAQADPWSIAGQYQSYDQLGDVYKDFGGMRDEYGDLYRSGGMDAIDMARWEESKARNLALAKGQREAAMQGLEMRGMGSSGADLTAALSAGEAATARQSAESLEIEALKQKRRMDALAGAGDMAGAMADVTGQQGDLMTDIRTGSFDEAFDRGTATDKVNEFNATVDNDAETLRVNEVNDARDRSISDANAAQAGNVDRAWGAWSGDADARDSFGEFYNITEPKQGWEAARGLRADTANIHLGNPVLPIAQDAGRATRALFGEGAKAGANLLSQGLYSAFDKDDEDD